MNLYGLPHLVRVLERMPTERRNQVVHRYNWHLEDLRESKGSQAAHRERRRSLSGATSEINETQSEAA